MLLFPRSAALSQLTVREGVVLFFEYPVQQADLARHMEMGFLHQPCRWRRICTSLSLARSFI